MPVAPVANTPEKIMRRRPRVSEKAVRERRELDPGTCCPECGGELRLVGEDVSEILDMIAAQMKVIEVARLKKSCRCCEKMVQLPAPSRPIPGSMAGATSAASLRELLRDRLRRRCHATMNFGQFHFDDIRITSSQYGGRIDHHHHFSSGLRWLVVAHCRLDLSG